MFGFFLHEINSYKPITTLKSNNDVVTFCQNFLRFAKANADHTMKL